MNSGKLGIIFTYILGVLQATLYTPVVFSFALFIIIIPMLFQNDSTNPFLRLLPDGNYTMSDVLSIYGKYAFGTSLIISFLELALKRRIVISVRKKITWLGLLLLTGYCLMFVFFTTKTRLTIGATLIVLIPFFLVSFLAVILSAILSARIDFINKHTDSSSKPSS